jgi:hypothetical protein
VRGIAGVILHPDYDFRTLHADIALIKLSSAAPVEPIEVAKPNEFDIDGGTLIGKVLGWGRSNPYDAVYPAQLHEATIPIHSDATCVLQNGVYFEPSGMVCAGILSSSSALGSDTCDGDSGGPLFVEGSSGGIKLLGLTSFGLGACASSETFGTYTEIPAYWSFATSRPEITPYPREEVRITGEFGLGRKLTCIAGEWRGDPAREVQFAWYRRPVSPFIPEYGELPEYRVRIENANSRTYRIQEEDLDKAVLCTVTASNSGGSFTAESLIPRDSGDSGTSRDGESEEEGKPTAPVYRGTSCEENSCVMHVRSKPSAEFKRVVGKMLRAGANRRPRIIVAESMDGENWYFRFKKPRKHPGEFTFYGVTFRGRKTETKTVRVQPAQ